MFIVVIAFSIIVAASEVDLIVPSFPEMQHIFGLTPFAVELALSLNLFAHCIAGLFAGNLGDKFGHRYTILWGFALFIVGSVLGALAPNFGLLLFSRVLQGIGVAPAIVLGYVVATEKYPLSEQGKIMGLLNGMVGISLALAPVLGSYVTSYFGYKGNFALMAISGLMGIIALKLFIPSDKQHNKEIGLHLNEYLPVLKNKRVSLYIIWLSLIPGAYYTFVGIASLLFIKGLKLSLFEFGFYMGITTFAFGSFSIFSGTIMRWLGRKRTFNISVILLVCFLALTLFLVITDNHRPELIVLSTVLFAIGAIIPINEGFVLTLENLPEAKGKISALVSTFKWIFTIMGVQTASYFYQDNYVPIGLTLFVMMLISLTLMVMTFRRDANFKKAFHK